MNPPINSPVHLQTLTPALAAALESRTQSTLLDLLTRNRGTKYFNESPLLASYRSLLHNDDLLDLFYKSVPLSSYLAYKPFIARFLAPNPNASDLTDLLAPGLPEFISHSSGTSGGAVKHFPKYRHAQYTPAGQPSAKQLTMSICGINSLRYSQVLHIVDLEKGGEPVIKKVPVCLMSCGGLRQYLGVGVDYDEALMAQR